MSYDLYLAPRSGNLDSEDITRFLLSRPNYKAGKGQAWYENQDTGVYFVFNFQSQARSDDANHQKSFPIALNINYFRPSYFVLEAEPEVTAFVRHFNLTAHDPQIGGMGEGDYDPNLLVSGWVAGNEFGYSAILSQQKETKTLTYPSERLHSIWRWNFERKGLQATLGARVFVPKISFLTKDGSAKSFVVWPDKAPTVIPEVDYLFVLRRDYAPRRLFKRQEDSAIASREDAMAVLQPHDSRELITAFVPDYEVIPRSVERFIRSLDTMGEPPKGVAPDQVLDAELVEAFRKSSTT